MRASLKSEFRKLLSVRSTYIFCGIGLIALLFFAFYISGIRAEAKALLAPNYLANQSLQAMNALAGIYSIVGLLILGHEYRYNTIMYTLTASNSRLRTLFAKIITISCFAIVISLLTVVLSPSLAVLGAHLAGHQISPQTIPVANLLWRCLFYGWAYSMAALLLIALIRNQIGAIVTLLFAPVTIEPLLSLLLKSHTVYLPFTALSQVLAIPGADAPPAGSGTLSPGRGAAVFGLYLLVGWVIAAITFVRRDAN